MPEFRALALHPLPGLVSFFEPSQELPAQVKEDSPAILVMTDLRYQIALTVEPNVSIDWALQRMKTAGVRLLFVVNSDKQVLGLITSTDIQGEKPLQFHQELHLRYEEIMVRDIMTPQVQLEVLNMEDVMRAAVGDIVTTLRSVGRRHALVLDEDPRFDRPAIRGIFSVSQISKQLNRSIETTEVAQTFAEVEAVLNN
ncbi:MAG TPA: CBS domain-containing protein [Gammaproteobacteria bacterium]|nr:CBS domain-containing protein [Gammaproteobacteria bacterium]